MTAIELRASISNDLSILEFDALESISRYVNRLAMRVRKHKIDAMPTSVREVPISNHIHRLSGRFSVPSDMDYKSIKGESLANKFAK